ncbi:MAG: ABC transporter permease, partial [Deltaproteobacteria bacterium]|nr:ABC transporter permease [Deltaproteobacteria bacterium]
MNGRRNNPANRDLIGNPGERGLPETAMALAAREAPGGKGDFLAAPSPETDGDGSAVIRPEGGEERAAETGEAAGRAAAFEGEPSRDETGAARAFPRTRAFPKPDKFTAFLLICAALAIIASFVEPGLLNRDPHKTDIRHKFLAPSLEYPLGTDQLGRCVFTRLLVGARSTFGVSFVTALAIFVLGTFLGLLSGFAGGMADFAIMRLADLVMSFPAILLAVAFSALAGPSPTALVTALSILWWGPTARFARDAVREIRERAY